MGTSLDVLRASSFLSQPDEHSHIVCFYDDDPRLVQVTTHYLCAGLARQEPLIVVATRQHAAQLCQCLDAEAYDVAEECHSGRMKLIDAHEMLSRLIVKGMPSWEAVCAHLGTVLEAARREAGSADVRAFGEMVNILAAGGNLRGAIVLEEMWNELGTRHSFSLLCGYQRAHVPREVDIDEVVRTHTHALRRPPQVDEHLHNEPDNLPGLVVQSRQVFLREREDERRRTIQRQLDEANTIVSTTPMMIWRSGPDAKCTYFNDTWLHFTGRALEQELGDGWAEGVHPDDLERCLAIYMRAIRTCQPFEMEYRLRRHDGEYRYIFDRGTPLVGRSGEFEGFVGSCVDVDDRVRAERDLREGEARMRVIAQRLDHSEGRLRAILDSAADAIINVSDTGVICSVNRATSSLWGSPADELVGRPVSTVLDLAWPPDVASKTMGEQRRLYELVGKRRDGSTYPAEVAVSSSHAESSALYTLIIRDVSERRELECCMLEAGEALQRRIGQDLHDSLGQLLTGLAFIAKGVQAEAPQQLRERMTRLTQLITEALHRTQDLARGLSPLHIENMSLREALTELVHAATSVFRMDFLMEWDSAIPEPAQEVKHQLYLIAQEAVTNAVRHSGGDEICIRAAVLGDRYALVVRDNGRGLGTGKGKGVGMQSMTYRARVIGGRLDVVSRTPGGVEVTCVWSEQLQRIATKEDPHR